MAELLSTHARAPSVLRLLFRVAAKLTRDEAARAGVAGSPRGAAPVIACFHRVATP
jgi:hypothetical protein